MKRIFPLLFMLLSVSAYADKYDDLIANMRTQTPNIAFYNYQQFQKKNPQIGNVYYQLGKISYDYLRQINPLHDLTSFQYYAYNARLYYGNCLHFATDNEIRKNAAYYTGVTFSGKPNVAALNAHIRPILQDISTLATAGNTLHAAFVRLLSQYERCVQLFLALNTQFDSFNDALLLATDADLETMHTLQRISDSIPAYINDFQAALANYKIKGYAPSFEIVPIELFRIDALCSANFFANNVVLYDFGAWVREFETRRNTRVLPILSEAQKAYQRLKHPTHFQASVSLINSLYQLDSQSYLAAVLQIRNVHNQVTHNQHAFAEAPNDKRLAMLYDMHAAIQTMHTQHARLQHVDSAAMAKYATFSQKHFAQTMPYESLAPIVTQTDAVYDTLLSAFRQQHIPLAQLDSHALVIPCGAGLQATVRYQPKNRRNQLTIESAERTIVKTTIPINAKPKAAFYLQDAEQLVFAHDVLNDSLLTPETRLTLYDLTHRQLIEWITLPQVDSIAYITTTDNGHAIVVNEATTHAVTLYSIDILDQTTRHPILAQAATIVSVGHYNAEKFAVYLMVDNNPTIVLVGKK